MFYFSTKRQSLLDWVKKKKKKPNRIFFRTDTSKIGYMESLKDCKKMCEENTP